MNKAHLIWALGCFFFCGPGSFFGCNHNTRVNKKPLAPPPRKGPLKLVLPSVDHAVFRLSSLRGKVVILNFFSTGCVPCQALFSRILKVRAAVGENRVGVVAVSVDRQRLFVKPYVETLSLPFAVLYGKLATMRTLGLTSSLIVPTTVILDRRGRPRYLHQNLITTRKLAAEVQSLL